ncbi:MAG: molybdopterin molybdenumtransferase MoeA [Alphaproteobacteria bacterium HGW-Alphaproteobacteria-3]|nr:MAG: molybdopterin molybdenumtransferase MoeA [Alphaproteobacteria bacterium HGW-Alphaproteobacteria-3]
MISFDEALRRVLEIAAPIALETIAFADAADRVLAEPVVARLSMPRQDVSAMDGYAVRDCDLGDLPVRLPLEGESTAGTPPGQVLPPRSAFRIFTGAPVPVGADRVIVQENVEREGDCVAIVRPYGPGRNIRIAGSDFREGDVLVPAGRRLDWRALTTAAAADQPVLRVFVRPNVAIIATGDELATPGNAAGIPGTIPESVSYGIAAFVRKEGGAVLWSRRSADDTRLLSELAVAALEEADLVVVIGGASVGDRDLSRTMFGEAPDYIFPRVAMKPGKPVWLARIRGRLVMGLPGNPTSALVTARLLLAPLLAGQCGRDAARSVTFEDWRLAADVPAAGDRETYVRARITPEGALPLGSQDSSSQASLLDADLLVRLRSGGSAFQAGDYVPAIRF